MFVVTVCSYSYMHVLIIMAVITFIEAVSVETVWIQLNMFTWSEGDLGKTC